MRPAEESTQKLQAKIEGWKTPSALAGPLGAVCALAALYYRGWVLAAAWNWVMVPLFALPRLYPVQMIALRFVWLVIFDNSPAPPFTKWTFGYVMAKAISSVITATMILGVAWVLKELM